MLDMSVENTLKRRTNQGCWTCRLRRKKCDEHRPLCNSCHSLSIPCFGYGQRPEWMDKGRREKAKAQEIKLLIKTERKRRTSLRSQDRQSDTMEERENKLENVTQTHERKRVRSEIDFQFPSPVSPPIISNDQTATENSFPLSASSDHIPFTLTLSNDDGFPTPLPTPRSRLNSSAGELSASLEATNFASWDHFTDMELLEGCSNLWTEEPYLFSPTTIDLAQPTTEIDVVRASPRHNVTFTCNMQYYMNHIIPRFFPFFSNETRQLFLSYIGVTNPAENGLATLASIAIKLIQQDEQVKFGLCSPRKHEDDCRRWFSEACEKLELYVALTSTETTLVTAPSLDCNISSKSIDGFDPAEPLMLVVHMIIIQTHCKSIDHISLEAIIKEVLTHCSSFTQISDKLCSHLVDFLIAFQIIWSSTHNIQTVPCMHLTRMLHMEEVTGCQSWVFQGIHQISQLRQWKRSQIELKSLNVAELVERSNQIGAYLSEQQLNMKRQPLSQQVKAADDMSSQNEIESISNVYHSALQIFLHTVISGPMPSVSHIKHHVQATVDAIKALPHTKLLYQLAWPLCVAASLADPQHDLFFDKLKQAIQSTQPDNINALHAFEIATECRRLRLQTLKTSDAFDWFDAIESLGFEGVIF